MPVSWLDVRFRCISPVGARPGQWSLLRTDSSRSSFGLTSATMSLLNGSNPGLAVDFNTRRCLLRDEGRQRIAWIGGQTVRFRQAELLAYDVGAKHHRHHLVLGVSPAHTFAAHAAIGGDDQPFGRHMLQRRAEDVGHLVRPLDLQGVVVDDPDDDLLARDRLPNRFQIAGSGGAGLERERVGIKFGERVERRAVALHVAEDALLERIAQQV